MNAASAPSGTILQSRKTRADSFEPFRCPGPARSTISFPCPRGRHLVTLKRAAEYTQKLPTAGQLLDERQAAVEVLLLVVELNSRTMMAPSASIETARFGAHGLTGCATSIMVLSAWSPIIRAHSSTFSW
jgi:hypothetical protein